MSEKYHLYKDQELLIMVKQGDRKGLELLFKKYHAPLYRFSYIMVKREDAADDIVQETFFKLWKLRDTISEDVILKSYLYTAVRNQSINHMEKENRNTILHEYPADLRSDHADAIAGLHSQELQQKITEAIDRLPDRCKVIFKLSRYEGMSYKEIATYLEVSIKTVENQMGTALKKLKTQLADYINI